jgi:hypothetical protein
VFSGSALAAAFERLRSVEAIAALALGTGLTLSLGNSVVVATAVVTSRDRLEVIYKIEGWRVEGGDMLQN